MLNPIAIKAAKTATCFILCAFTILWSPSIAIAQDDNHIFTAAPVDTETAGKNGATTAQAVYRLICPALNSSGTGFLHKSGNIITAAHVVHGCPDPEILLPDGSLNALSIKIIDDDFDVAILTPATPIATAPLPLSAAPNLKIGMQVVTWGFPGGYNGRAPLLSVGYLAGMDAVRTPSGKIVTQWVVNAAFNSGNSGGPLIQVETGDVIGVVSSKLTPLSEESSVILNTLAASSSGMQYGFTTTDGSTTTLSEAQIVEKVLLELRRQTQLVIGYAVLSFDLKALLLRGGVDP
jgi:S1-C subfamily serine protease